MADIKAFYEVSTSANGVFMKDGSFLFLSNKSGMNQVWRGRVGEEPVQVTNLPDRVWSLKAAPNRRGCAADDGSRRRRAGADFPASQGARASL